MQAGLQKAKPGRGPFIFVQRFRLTCSDIGQVRSWRADLIITVYARPCSDVGVHVRSDTLAYATSHIDYTCQKEASQQKKTTRLPVLARDVHRASMRVFDAIFRAELKEAQKC